MKMSAAELKKSVPDAAVFAVVGPEDVARKQSLSLISQRFLEPSFAEFDTDVIEGEGMAAVQALAAWQTIPVAAERRVVIVRNLQDAAPAEIETLSHSVGAAAPRGCLALESAADTGKDILALIKAVDKAGGVVVSCAAAKTEDARAFLAQEAASQGIKIDSAAAQEIVRRLGPNLQQLGHEVQKLASFVHPQTTVRLGDVDALIPPSPEDRIFAMIDAVCDGRAQAAGEMLRDLFSAGDDERGTAHRTLAVLARHFRLLWQARLLRDKGFAFRDMSALPAGAQEMLPSAPSLMDALKRTPFLMGKYRAQAERFDLPSIREAFNVLAETDLALKGRSVSVGDPFADLEMCIWRLARVAARASREGRVPARR